MVVHLDTANEKSYSGTGSIVQDISIEGLKRNATFVGGHTISSEGMYVNGVDGYGEILQPSVTFSSGEILQEWSIGLFVKPDSDSGWIISPASAGADHNLRNDLGNNSFVFQVTESSDVNNRNLSSTNGSVPGNNLWTYVLCTLKGIEMKIYINGQLNVTRTNDVSIANWSGSWRIGARSIFTGSFFRGLLQNIHIYNRELSENEVMQNFQAFKGRYDNLRYR
jgi:hypothetical protein